MLDYVKQQQEQGVSDSDIKQALRKAGWQAQDVESAFKPSESTSFQPSHTTQVAPESILNSAKPVMPQKNIIILIIASVVALGLIAGGVWAYYYFFQSPDQMIGRMMEKMSEVRTGEYTLKVNGQIKGDIPLGPSMMLAEPSAEPQELNFNLTLSGVSDMRDLSNLKAGGSFVAQGQAPGMDVMDISFETRVIGDVSYFKINSLPDMPMLNISSLMNTWIKFDPQEIGDQLGFNPQQMEEMENELQPELAGHKLTDEQIEDIGQLIYNEKLFKVVENLGSEKVNGVNCYHYLVTINKAVLPEIILEIGQIVDQPLEAYQEADMRQDLAEINFPDFEIWIGKSDKYLHRLAFQYQRQEPENEIMFDIKAEMTMSQHNQEVTIQAPTESKSIQEVMEVMMQEMMGGMEGSMNMLPGTTTDPGLAPTDLPPTAINTELDTDNDGLPDELEAYYGTDINNPDTDNDGYTDGQEVQNGYNPAGEGKLYEMELMQ